MAAIQHLCGTATGRCWPMSARRVASASGHKPNDPKASTEGGIHEPRVPGSRAPGLAGLKAFRVAGFGALRVAGLGALQVAGLRVESVAGLIGIRTILSDAEQEALYGLPDFDDSQRLEYLALSEAELALAVSRPSLHAQVYCVLQIGYFKAKHASVRFDWSEVEDDCAFVLTRYFHGEAFEHKAITKHEHYTQRERIAELFGYRGQLARAHATDAWSAAATPTRSQTRRSQALARRTAAQGVGQYRAGQGRELHLETLERAGPCRRRWSLPDRQQPDRNAIRPIAIGRKNWLFAGSETAGKRAAAIMRPSFAVRRRRPALGARINDLVTLVPCACTRKPCIPCPRPVHR